MPRHMHHVVGDECLSETDVREAQLRLPLCVVSIDQVLTRVVKHSPGYLDTARKITNAVDNVADLGYRRVGSGDRPEGSTKVLLGQRFDRLLQDSFLHTEVDARKHQRCPL